MPRDTRQVTPLRPSPVAIHNYSDVLRQVLQFELIEKAGLCEADILQKFGGFHKISPKTRRQEKLAHRPKPCKDSAPESAASLNKLVQRNFRVSGSASRPCPRLRGR